MDKYLKSLRIQRKRTKGYKMPEGVKYVGRGSKWGNPFKLWGDMVYVDAGHRRGKILDKWVCYYDGGGYTVEDVFKLFSDMMLDVDSYEVEPEVRDKFIWMRQNIKDLKGVKLACWCSTEACCHGDILVYLAND